MVAERARLGATSTQIQNAITLPVFTGKCLKIQHLKEEKQCEDLPCKPGKGEGGGGGGGRGAAGEGTMEGSGGVATSSPSSSAMVGGGDLSGPSTHDQGSGSSGASFRCLTQTRLNRINLILDYMKKQRTITDLVGIFKVGITGLSCDCCLVGSTGVT